MRCGWEGYAALSISAALRRARREMTLPAQLKAETARRFPTGVHFLV